MFRLMQARLLDIMNMQRDVIVSSGTYNIFSNWLLDLASVETELSSQSIRDIAPIFIGQIKQIMQALSEASQAEFPAEIPNSTLESLQELAPLVPEEKREKFVEIVAPSKAAEQKILTIENVKWLLGIIIPILFSLFLYLLPDKNAEEHNQLHRDEIVVEQEDNELRKEEIELFREFFDYVKENGISFPEQVYIVEEDVGVLKDDVDTFDDPDLPDLETNERPDQPSGQDSQD